MRREQNFSAYITWFFVTALVLFLVCFLLSGFFRPLEGDLTRIGKWAERDFGPSSFSDLSGVKRNGANYAGQEILVLGDSFSHVNAWQTTLSSLVKREALTFEFKDVGCVDNWVNWVLAQPRSSVRVVIIEIAERSFVPFFRTYKTCPASKPAPSEFVHVKHSSRFMSGIALDPIYLFLTGSNSLRTRIQKGRINSGLVANTPLSNAQLFSNLLSDRLLYYTEDDGKKQWTARDIGASIDNLKLMQRRLDGINLLVTVVPDKSSVYRPYMVGVNAEQVYPRLVAGMSASGIKTIDLLSLFQKNVETTVDLYKPNDTHLSASGYRLMGSAVAADLENDFSK